MRLVGRLLLAAALVSGLNAYGQTPEKIDMEMVNKIKAEGLEKSEVMETISYLTDVHGPRLTGSPITKKAGE